jgi:hypothetical protein
MKDENKAMKTKEDQLVKEVGKQKEGSRQIAPQEDLFVKELAEGKHGLNKLRPPLTQPRPIRQFPPSVKKGKLCHGDGNERTDT